MGLSGNINEKANLIWVIADKLTGAYKPNEYDKATMQVNLL